MLCIDGRCRVTKDLDIVLCIEALSKEFVEHFWDFVKNGHYKTIKKSTGDKCFYRFTDPDNKEYPVMLEILSRKPSILTEREPGSIIPMILEEEIVSLSAILLNEEYYQFIMNLRFEIDGLIVADERCLIPLKARAWLDLKQRKQDGEAVRSRDIKKHKNDIYRMTQLLTNISIENVPKLISDDIQLFVENIEDKDILLKQLRIENLTIAIISKRLVQVYCSNSE